jgi:hypothetical protein
MKSRSRECFRRRALATEVTVNNLHTELGVIELIAARLRYERWGDALRSCARAPRACDSHRSKWRASSRALMTLSAIAPPHRWVLNSARNAESGDILTP